MKKYFGKQTEKALDNFPYPLPLVHIELIYALAQIKKSAAKANTRSGILSSSTAQSIVKASEDIIKGKYGDQFVTTSLQGGAGTSINMNVNEVIATLARAHPNDHVNCSQSTNDVNPSALKIACLILLPILFKNIEQLVKSFQSKAKQYNSIKKLSRTHLQDAIPTSISEEFLSYAAIIERDGFRIKESQQYLYELNLGGTAIGNSINASKKYIKYVYEELRKDTKLSLRPAENLMSQTSSSSDFCHLSSLLTILALDMSKIATDLRILSSGPAGGIGEVRLQSLQDGSSIMPGKVNPVIPESMNQVYYFISGKNLSLHQAAEASSLELAIMFPVVADSLLSSLKLLISAVKVFDEKCIRTLAVDKKRCQQLLEQSTAYATLLTPKLGYDKVSELVKEANASQKTLRETVLKNKVLNEKEFDMIVTNY